MALAAIGMAALGWYRSPEDGSGSGPQTVTPAAQPQFVGSHACASCHALETAGWQASQHHRAMAEANEQNVSGSFDGSTFTYAGTTSGFTRRDGAYYVRTDGRDGTLADFQVKYAFGLYPLQQYLVEFADGRLQALSIAWDTRSSTAGGQRWFHLYPDERVTHEDELHWTRPAQNWNFMCADCHSTGMRKNYDPRADRFQTRWSETSVGCEACHGPGSRHLEWAAASRSGHTASIGEDKGLNVRFDTRRGSTWTLDPASGTVVHSRPRATEREMAVCAQCHARRSQIADGYEAGKPFLDFYRPALLSDALYHADGQQRDEVYTWGSFLQSKMYAKGVTCSDCHNSHTGTLRAAGNTLCATCHLPSRYDTASHHKHQTGAEGGACASCHMPATTYMVVDPRHDHSFRVPRPDLSVALGTPNACTACHSNRTAQWAAQRVRQWYGRDAQGFQTFASSFSAVVNADASLDAIAGDLKQPAIVRATALARLDARALPAAPDALAKYLRDPDALVRLGALQALADAPSQHALLLAMPLLSDPVRAVRIEAVGLLSRLRSEQLPATERAAFERAAGEFIESQRYNADRAEARVNLGTFLANRGDIASAEEELKAAIRMDPAFIPAYVNLADVFRVAGRDADGEQILKAALKAVPGSGVLHHALGLVMVRRHRTGDALGEFERAATLEPGNARFAYVYAVALHSLGRAEDAIGTLEKALVAHPGNADIQSALGRFKQSR